MRRPPFSQALRWQLFWACRSLPYLCLRLRVNLLQVRALPQKLQRVVHRAQHRRLPLGLPLQVVVRLRGLRARPLHPLAAPCLAPPRRPWN
jgi:hypothetical protein